MLKICVWVFVLWICLWATIWFPPFFNSAYSKKTQVQIFMLLSGSARYGWKMLHIRPTSSIIDFCVALFLLFLFVSVSLQLFSGFSPCQSAYSVSKPSNLFLTWTSKYSRLVMFHSRKIRQSFMLFVHDLCFIWFWQIYVLSRRHLMKI